MNSGIHSVSFNNDNSCFICCLNNGIHIFNADPLTFKASLSKEHVGSISKGFLLNRTNIIALVSGGSTVQFSENMVLLWDDLQKKFVLEYIFPQPVLSVKMRKECIFIVLRNEIYIYSLFTKSKLLFSYQTRANPKGLCEITSSEGRILIFPGPKCGSLQVVDLDAAGDSQSSLAPVVISAHNSELACLALSQDGKLAATASRKGTLVRIFNVKTRRRLMELRRGADQANFYAMNFSADAHYLCAASDKGTVHIWAVNRPDLNRRSALQPLAGAMQSATGRSTDFLGQYIDSRWAMATFTVPQECACIPAFAANSSVIAVCLDGSYHKYVFNQDGNCNRESFDIYLDLVEENES